MQLVRSIVAVAAVAALSSSATAGTGPRTKKATSGRPTRVRGPATKWEVPEPFLARDGSGATPIGPLERQLVGPEARQRTLAIGKDVVHRLNGIKHGRQLKRKLAKASPETGADTVAVARVTSRAMIAAFDTVSEDGPWSQPDGFERRVRGYNESGARQRIHVLEHEPQHEEWQQFDLSVAPAVGDRVRFSLTERYDDRKEYGTRRTTGLELGRVVGKSVFLTKSSKIARLKPRGLFSLVSYVFGSTQGPTRYRFEIGRLSLPTFGFGKRIAARNAEVFGD